MSLVLNTNIDSIVAQNNLNGSQSLLSQSLTRLSSGLRINSAADDAAGLAISQQFTTQVNGTNQAINNANDAVSESQTAAGALTTIVNNLQSIRTLAVEAANGSNSASDRQALDQQVQQQIAEITQIAQQTTFNGLNVLNGSSGVQTYQVGANVGNTISINLAQGVGANQVGAVASTTTAVATGGTSGALTIAIGNGTATTIGASSLYATTASSGTGGSAYAYQDATSAYAKSAAINGANISGLTATANNSQDVTFGNVTVGTGGYSLAVNGVTVLNATSGHPDRGESGHGDQQLLDPGRRRHSGHGRQRSHFDGGGRQQHPVEPEPESARRALPAPAASRMSPRTTPRPLRTSAPARPIRRAPRRSSGRSRCRLRRTSRSAVWQPISRRAALRRRPRSLPPERFRATTC